MLECFGLIAEWGTASLDPSPGAGPGRILPDHQSCAAGTSNTRPRSHHKAATGELGKRAASGMQFERGDWAGATKKNPAGPWATVMTGVANVSCRPSLLSGASCAAGDGGGGAARVLHNRGHEQDAKSLGKGARGDRPVGRVFDHTGWLD